jgi:uncharacterized membrane protein
MKEQEHLLERPGSEIGGPQKGLRGAIESVAHLRRERPAVRNVNKEFRESFSSLERVALFITVHIGSFGFFLIILAWTILWLAWNTLGPPGKRFDPAPAFVLWLFISNMLQILLMPLIMVGQNLLSRHAELRAESDFDVNVKAEKEIEAILLHLEDQARHLERQGELMLQILKRLETTDAATPNPAAAGGGIGTEARPLG